MVSENTTTQKMHGKIFRIQLLECFLVFLIFVLAYALAGKYIYNHYLPFGRLDGIVVYFSMAATALIILGIQKFFGFLDKPVVETASKILGIAFVINAVMIAVLYFSRSISLSLYYFIVAGAFQVMLLVLLKRFSALLKKDVLRNRISLVIGNDPQKSHLLSSVKKNENGRVAFIPFHDDKLKDHVDQADNIYLSQSVPKKLKEKIINYCVLREKKIFIVPETYEIAIRSSMMTQAGDVPLFSVESFRLTESQNIIKRAMDIGIALVGIVLLSPLMLITAIFIKREDGGPIFYKQLRSGRNGSQFQVIKFRSMVMDAERFTGAVFAAENDPRITRAGRFIRATRIDEIPQFFNVLKGEMSVVGPRPERPMFVEEFSRELPEYTSRLAVKPGITGLAQVMGNYTTTPENKVKFDLVYIRNYSLLLDIKILFRTIKVVFKKEQAEGFAKKDNTFDLQNFISNGAVRLDQNRIHTNRYRVAKAFLIFLCCLLVVTGSTFMRYTALASTVMEATAHPTDTEERSYVEDKPGRQTESAFLRTTPILQAQEEIVITNEEIDNAIHSMTLDEKAQIVLKLISKLDSKELMKLEQMADGGLTENEKTIAKEMVYKRFDDAEVEFIKEMYREYLK